MIVSLPTAGEALGSDPSAKHTHIGILGETPSGQFAHPHFPGSWQFQPMPSATEARRLPSGYQWLQGPFKNPSRPPRKSFLPDRLFLICNPSHFRTMLAPGLASAEGRHRLGPNCSSCGSSFQVGSGGDPSGLQSVHSSGLPEIFRSSKGK